MVATWTTNRTSNSKYQNAPKEYTSPERRMFNIVVGLQREGVVRAFRTQEPLFLGYDENGRQVWCKPDFELALNTEPTRLAVVRVQGWKWHIKREEPDEDQRERLENLHYKVVDVWVNGKDDWKKIEATVRKELS